MASGAFIGAALYRRSFLRLLNNRDFSIVPVWKRGIDRGWQIGIIEVANCFWRDIGTPAALARAHFDCIDGTTPLDVPDRLSIDREGGRCFLRSMPEHSRRALGRHAWVETEQVGEDVRISESVVFPGVNLAAGRTLEKMLVMPACEVPFGL
jgi:NDP-sugar pyrophosphorylase family protein